MKSIKIRIYPNSFQREFIEKQFGCCRWVYNYALAKKIDFYEKIKNSPSDEKNDESKEKKSKYLTAYTISKDLPGLKKENPWLAEVGAQALQVTLQDLDAAYKMFFQKHNRFPRFKSKKNPKQSYSVPQNFKIFPEKRAIKLPKIGKVRFRDKFDFEKAAKFRSVTVSRNAVGEYYASVLYDPKKEMVAKSPIEFSTTVGIDLGVKTFATFSDGTKIENPKHLGKKLDKISLEQQRQSKKDKESKSFLKSKFRISKLHQKVRNSRNDFIHKLTTNLVKNQSWNSIAIEDLSSKKMMETAWPKLSQLIGDAGWDMFRNTLAQKCEEYGKNLLIIDRFEPSSKMCSCGYLNNNLKLSEREWSCPKCGVTHDRDILAANNIRLFATVGHTVPQTEGVEKIHLVDECQSSLMLVKSIMSHASSPIPTRSLTI